MDPETTPAPQRELAEPAPAVAPGAVDWGDEEPDEVWLDLYERGLVRPPYRGPRAVRALAEKMTDWEPLGDDITDEDILRWIGREIDPDGVKPGGSATAEPVVWPGDELGDAQPAPAVLPPRVELNGATEELLRALGLPDLCERDLAQPTDRGPNSHEIADILEARTPIHFKGGTEDILRALGRL